MTSAEEELDQLLELVSAVGDSLAKGGPLDAVLQASCQALVDHVGAAFARVWLLERDAGILRLHASAGQYTHLDGEHGRIPLGSLEIGFIAESGQPVLSNDVVHENRITDREWALREGMVSFAGHPLVVDGELAPKQARYVENISTAGKHLLALVNDILDLAKVTAGHIDLELAERPPAAAAEIAIGQVRSSAEKKGIELSLVAESRRRVVVDERRLTQILLNLLSNAIKFTPANGWVRLRVYDSGPLVTFAVEDGGVGIDAVDLERIFLEFEQAQAGRNRGSEGTGLGLPLSRQLAELMGGTLTAESTLGAGSTFLLRLPAAPRS